MYNLRYGIRLIYAYITRFKGILLIGIIIGVVFFFVAYFASPYLSIKSERIGLTGRYHTNELPIEVLEMISGGLTKIDKAGTPEPSISSSWETVDKGKTWIFHLRDNVMWHDESLLLSNDINYEFSDVEIERPDEKTIIFKLKDIFVPFPNIVSKPTFKKGLVGTGEWRVHKITLAGEYVNELVLKKVDGGKGKYLSEKKVYRFYPTIDRTKLAFKLGEIDKIQPVIDPTPFDEWETVVLESITDTSQVVTIFFNTKSDFLSDKSIRQALYYTLDKEALGKRAISPISPGSWAYNPQVKKYKHDKEKALEIIKELKIDEVEKDPLKLVSTPLLLKTAEKIEKDWEDVGIDTVVQVSSIIPDDFHAFLTIYDMPNDPDQYALWHSTQLDTNISNYSNPRIDKLLEDGRVSLDFEERKKLYIDFQRFLLEDAPAAFLYHPTYYTIRRK